MKILFTNYNTNISFNDPLQWINRIKAYAGVMEMLGQYHTVITIEHINYTGELDNNGVKYYFRAFNKRAALFPGSLHRFIKKINPDIIIVHGSHYPLQVIQLKLSVKTAKIIVQNHAEKPYNKPKSYLQKLADQFIDAYMFTSEDMAAEWINKKIISSEKKVWGIMEASSFFSPVPRKEAIQKTGVSGAPVFLFVGRLNDNKDPLMVVRSFLRYNKLQSSSRLYMIYQTTDLLTTIEKTIADAENGHTIILVGKKDHDLMPCWYSSADFIISASHYEGSGVAVCEGMSCGCIPILSAITSFKKITANGACGILYDIDDKDGLFNALIKTQRLDIKAEKEKVLQQFHADLSFDAIATQMAEKISTL